MLHAKILGQKSLANCYAWCASKSIDKFYQHKFSHLFQPFISSYLINSPNCFLKNISHLMLFYSLFDGVWILLSGDIMYQYFNCILSVIFKTVILDETVAF